MRIRKIIKITCLAVYPGFSQVFAATLDGEIVRINGSRFIATQVKDVSIFIPTDESFNEEQRIQKTLCSSHIPKEDVLRLRSGQIIISDANLNRLPKVCTLPHAKESFPQKAGPQDSSTYDHQNAKSYKSLIDYLLKK